MKIKHHDIEIPADNPFANCKLERKKYAEALTGIVSSYSDGFVLAINNEWGTGKTTFIKMWQQHLNKEEFKTLYFNAWENDFESNPLVAILSEIKTLTPHKAAATFKSLLKKGAIISQSVFPAIISALAKKYIDTDEIKEVVEKLTDAATDILKEEIDEYAAKKKGLLEFREELKNYIEKKGDGKPLIFFIDELDRCRPNYAVEVLEQVKHFFNVEGIVFVLSIDKVQLCNAIKGVYGSEQINTDEYLRRFIDLEYIIPPPDTGVFCNYLYEYFQFDDFINSTERRNIQAVNRDKTSIISFSELLFGYGNTTLRQQEKIYSHARIVLNYFKANNYIFPELFIFLIYVRNINLTLYKKIKQIQLTPQELINEFEALFPQKINPYQLRELMATEALLVLFYNNFYAMSHSGSRIIDKHPETRQSVFYVNSGAKFDNSAFHSFLESFEKERHSDVKLDYLLDKIELTQSNS